MAINPERVLRKPGATGVMPPSPCTVSIKMAQVLALTIFSDGVEIIEFANSGSRPAAGSKPAWYFGLRRVAVTAANVRPWNEPLKLMIVAALRAAAFVSGIFAHELDGGFVGFGAGVGGRRRGRANFEGFDQLFCKADRRFGERKYYWYARAFLPVFVSASSRFAIVMAKAR